MTRHRPGPKPRARRFALVATLALALGSGCGPAAPPRMPGAVAPLAPRIVRVGTPDGRGRVREMPVEQYVLASVLTEIAPTGADRAAARRVFEVQAIVARTYATANLGRHASQGFDLCDSTHCQLVDTGRLSTSPWRDVARDAVNATAAVVLTYQGRPIQAVFHADCGGHTSAADAVWAGTPVAYLTGRPDDLPRGARHQVWTVAATGRQLAEAVARHGGPSPGDDVSRVDVLERDGAGRVVRLTLQGTRQVTLRGAEFRTALSAALGPRGLRSTLFTVSRAGGRFVFEGRGFGHGVGLCQAGALARARAGQSPRDILAFYYPGAVLTRSR